MPELFRSQLSSVGMTIKNESSVEIDMLDSDDFYSYHGGLIACVRDCSGQRPRLRGGPHPPTPPDRRPPV